MMTMMMMMSLIITQSAAISQSFFCFVLPSFFNMGTPSISKFSYCGHSVCSSSSSSLPCLLPFPSLLPLASKTTPLSSTWLWEGKAFPKPACFLQAFSGKGLGKGLGEGKALGKGSGEEGKA